jgi:hypothetical protein
VIDSKLETGRKQLAQVLETFGSRRLALIDSATCQARELEKPAALRTLPDAGPTSAAADLPAMLQAASDYIRNNRCGRTEVWICSDLRANDWTPESGRWSTLRAAFLEFPQGVRFQLLAYPQTMQENLAVRVTEARRASNSDGAELLVSFRLSREGSTTERLNVPVQFEIDGARSVVNVELTGPFVEFKDHRLPLEAGKTHGWARVSIPADASPGDDDFYFVFDNPPPRRTVVVTEEPAVERPLKLATSIAPEAGMTLVAEPIEIENLPTIEWDEIALVLWQAGLPSGSTAELLTPFVERGGQVVCFPPQNPGDQELFGVRWQTWAPDSEVTPVENWRGDEDLLARTLSGAALPVGQLEIRRHCGLQGELIPLATLRGGAPLLARSPTKRGGVYFWTTTPATRDSSLATDGVVLYAVLQRALAAGAAVLGKARQLDAGDASGESPANWRRLAQTDEGISTEFQYLRGAYSAGDRLLAVNRPVAEDNSRVMANTQVAALFQGLDFIRVDDEAGAVDSLVQEIWRGFLLAMLVALLLEAALCLPNFSRTPGATA